MKKNVTLKRLQMTNFKGIRSKTIDFHPEETTIAGDNATGKTTVFDAFTWCLFGKDSQNKENFTVKTVGKDGEPIHRLQHEVTTVLSVNGYEKTFTRQMTEKWTTKSGELEPKLTSHDYKYFVDGGEKKAKEFNEEVANVIDEKLFKLITNPAHFPNLPWQDQRKILLTIAGDPTYDDMAKGDKDLEAVLREIAGTDMEAFRKRVNDQIKKIKDEQDKCTIEINAIDGVTPDEPDYTTLRAEKEAINDEIKEIDTALTNASEAARQQYEKARKKQQEINELKTKKDTEEFEAKRDHNKREAEKNEARRQLYQKWETARRNKKADIESIEQQIATAKRHISSANDNIETINTQIQEKRDEWNKVNAEEYKTSEDGLVCPLYGIICGDKDANERFRVKADNAREEYHKKKIQRLNRINEFGAKLAEEAREEEARKEKYQETIDKLEAQLKEKTDEYDAKIKKLDQEIANTPEVKPTQLDTTALPAVIELNERIAQLTAELEEANKADDRPDNTRTLARKQELNNRLKEIEQELAVEVTIKNNRDKIKQIHARAKDLAQQKAELDKQDYNAGKLHQKLMDEVQSRVSSLFKLVDFQMFRKQLNGGETPTCVATVDGVQYNDLNNAMKINAGLDIINALSEYHKVLAPIFCDNAESVNEYLPTGSQMVYLKVSKDKDLTITP